MHTRHRSRLALDYILYSDSGMECGRRGDVKSEKFQELGNIHDLPNTFGIDFKNTCTNKVLK